MLRINHYTKRYAALSKQRARKKISKKALMFAASSYGDYLQRCNAAWPGVAWAVFDCGTEAVGCSNACFWLSVVAAWSRLPYVEYNGNDELDQLAQDVASLGSKSIASMCDNRPALGDDALGELAHRLRMLIAGTRGYMTQHEALWSPSFVALQCAGCVYENTDLNTYQAWLERVSVREFADELVLAATARCLRLCIRTVPYTPPGQDQWAIIEHPCFSVRDELGYDPTRVVLLGNNDVHYVTLAASDS
jgi:hypothetical protein